MLLLLSFHAFASGYYFIDSGVRAFGRGGAFVAGADDQSAQYYNPAALANITQTMIDINVWTDWQSATFDREDEDGVEPFDPVSNSLDSPDDYIIEPQGGIVAPLRGLAPWLKDTTVAVGLYVPSAPYYHFPADGASRYSVIDELVWQIYAGPSIAQRLPFARWITLGAGLQYTFLRVEQSLVSTVCVDGFACGSDDPANDLSMDLSVWDPGKISGNFGLLVEPTKWMKIGASTQLPIHYEAPGTLTGDFDENNALVLPQLTSGHVEDDDVTLLLTVPWVFRAGVEVQPVEMLKIELDGTYAMWSMMPEQRITDIDITVEGAEGGLLDGQTLTVTDDIVIKTGYQDAWSVRLGGDVNPVDWAKVRAGVFYETSAVPDSWLGQALIDRSKVGFGVGASFKVHERVGIDVGFSHTFLSTEPITDSELRQQALYVSLDSSGCDSGDTAHCFPTSIGYGKPVGNGTLDSSVTFVGLGASFLLGKPGSDGAGP